MRKFCCYSFFLLFSHSVVAQGAWDSLPNLPDHYRQKVEEFKKEPIIKGKVIFLGNSLTENGNWKKLLKDSSVINRGISGDVTFGVLRRLDEIVKRQPSRLFLMIGINDISKNIPDEVIMENVFSIVRRIKVGSPKTKIYLQTILPTNRFFKTFPSGYDKNDHVITLNGEFRKYAVRLGYSYIDLYSEFLDDKGYLEKKYSLDGLHLNQPGYEHWVQVLRTLNCLNK